ncbi:MAG: DUF1048 domain-containing protein [Actinobacteria bacterium]|nr:DUF1048 domain-containing protein [Actinomycetota bacterium]
MSGFVARVIGDKKEWRAYKARKKELPEDYRAALEAIQRYLMFFGSAAESTQMLNDLIDLFEQSAAEGIGVRDVVGVDPVEFIETFISNYPKDKWINRERTRLIEAIDAACGDQ